MKTIELTLNVVLENPVIGVAYGIQKGRGLKYDFVQTQVAQGQDLLFTINVQARRNKDRWDVYGPFTQGPADAKFFYIGIGSFAGQINSPWSRRLKIPFRGLTDFLTDHGLDRMIFETHVAGVGKDGGPNCGTVKPFEGWKLIHPGDT
ncbi:MAG TPA: DUF5990 family protein [Flavitalea sp.]|nr:DUF5990 family protein [Flavitalea sp.]